MLSARYAKCLSVVALGSRSPVVTGFPGYRRATRHDEHGDLTMMLQPCIDAWCAGGSCIDMSVRPFQPIKRAKKSFPNGRNREVHVSMGSGRRCRIQEAGRYICPVK
jgi:hypothetical protein